MLTITVGAIAMENTAKVSSVLTQITRSHLISC